MVQVLMELDEGGRLLFFEASGHAQYGTEGHDIVCAAVTVLLRTTVQALEDISAHVVADKRGFLSFRLMQYDESQAGRLQYAADFLWQGISSLQKEYPQCIQCKKIQR